MALIKLNNQSLTNVTSAGLPSGTVLQVVQTHITTSHSYNGQVSSPAATALTGSITPVSTNSKILVTMQGAFSAPSNNHAHQFLKRTINGTTTDVGQATATSNRPASSGILAAQISDTQTDNETYEIHPSLIQFLDSPSTTSEVTYTLYVGGYISTTFYLNRTIIDRDTSTYDPRMTSSVTLMEIAG